MSRFLSRTEVLPPQSRIAVMVVDEDGEISSPTMARSPILNALMDRGLRPVSLNLANARHLFAGITVEASASQYPAPILLENVRPYLKEVGATHLLLIHVESPGLDIDVRASLINVETMTVVASKHHTRDIMTPLCAATFFISWLYCPIIYAVEDRRKETYAYTDEAVVEFMRAID